MKHLEGIVKELETSYQKVVKGWVGLKWNDQNQTASEEEHQKKTTELLEENKELRKEKNELEQALRRYEGRIMIQVQPSNLLRVQIRK